jgi:hypothetical protein
LLVIDKGVEAAARSCAIAVALLETESHVRVFFIYLKYFARNV